MSADAEKTEHLQHDAEHERPGKKLSVMTYLAILFGAAFLLLLLSYFMQQRTASETIEGLKQSVTAMKSIEDLQEDNLDLQARLDALEADRIQQKQNTEDALQAARASQAALTAAQEQTQALTRLNQIRALYNQGRSSDARALLNQWETAAPGALEQGLTDVSAALTDAEREVYDPLEAYRQLVDWLI